MSMKFVAIIFTVVVAALFMAPASAYISAKNLPIEPDEPMTYRIDVYQFLPIGQWVLTEAHAAEGGSAAIGVWDVSLPIFLAQGFAEYTNPIYVAVTTTPPPGSHYIADHYEFDMTGGTTAYVTIVPVIDKWTFV